MSKDNLTVCPRCGSDACYETDLGADYKINMCYGCGFTTNTLMTNESQFLEEQLEVLPELYKDLVYEDENGQHWMPSTINNPEQGMIFIDGTSVDDWRWAACKGIELTQEEKERFPEDATHKMDMSTVKYFAERDFIEALDYIGVFENKEQ
jgi:hypothetical protein